MRRLFTSTAVALVLALPAFAADMITKISPHSVPETMKRLEAAITAAGGTVFARIDHAAGAQGAEMALRPTQVLIFGNPKLGTPAMQYTQTVGLDLPLRVLAYLDQNDVVHVVYHDPATLTADHGLPVDAGYIAQMSAALDTLTARAVAED